MISNIKNEIYISNKIKKRIITTVFSNTMNSLIVAGSKGLGKKNFILKLCKFMLCHFELNKKIKFQVLEKSNFCLDEIKINKSFHLFENNSHPDFFHLFKDENDSAKKIPIEKVRNLKTFFYKTYSVSKVKIAVIDTIEDLSINAMNLLLKTIEELPQYSYVFIISNKPINLPETIRSRCAFIYINPLSKKQINDLICQKYNNKPKQEILFLKNISFGSPLNISKIICADIYSLYDSILDDLIKSNSSLNFNENVISKLNTKENDFTLDILNLILNELIKKTVYYIHNQKYLDWTLDKEKELIIKISNHNNSCSLLDLNSQIDRNMYLADLLNVNKSDILINSFKDFCGM